MRTADEPGLVGLLWFIECVAIARSSEKQTKSATWGDRLARSSDVQLYYPSHCVPASPRALILELLLRCNANLCRHTNTRRGTGTLGGQVYDQPRETLNVDPQFAHLSGESLKSNLEYLETSR